MRVKINYKRFFISILTIIIIIVLIIKLVKSITSKPENNEEIQNEVSEIKDDIQSSNELKEKELIQKSIETNKEKIVKIKNALLASEYFTSKVKVLEKDDIVQSYRLEKFYDVECFALIEKTDDDYQEVVIVLSPHKEDYDEEVRSMILRYQDLRQQYQNDFGGLLDKTEAVSIKQEYGVTSLIVSNNMSKILKIIRETR